MNPAYSVIFFTTSSGAGYGLVVLLILLERLGLLNAMATLLGLVIALVLITSGLLASMFHLGHPERAWRALSQWRTSWLSREGVLAIVFYGPIGVYGLGLWFGAGAATIWTSGVAAILIALITVYATSQIYASLKTIPRWHDGRVVVVYLLMAIVSGALLAHLLISANTAISTSVSGAVIAVICLGWLVKTGYWRHIDSAPATSTAESATGLGSFGSVSLFESPHTSRNFVLREMGYEIARKHALRLRRIAIVSGAVLPVILIGAATASANQPGWRMLFASVAAVSGMLGIVVERWLFFAEAEHVATLFYGNSQV